MAFQFPLKDMEWSCAFFPHKMPSWRKELVSDLFEVDSLRQPLPGKRSANSG